MGLHPAVALKPSIGGAKRRIVASAPLCAGTVIGFVPASRAMDVSTLRNDDAHGTLPVEADCVSALDNCWQKNPSLSQSGDDACAHAETLLLSLAVCDAVHRGTGFGRWAEVVAVDAKATAGLISMASQQGRDALFESRSLASSLENSLAGAREVLRGSGEDGSVQLTRSALVPPLQTLTSMGDYVTSSLVFLSETNVEEEGAGPADELPGLLPLADLLTNVVIAPPNVNLSEDTELFAYCHAEMPNVSMVCCGASTLRKIVSKSHKGNAVDAGLRVDTLEALLSRDNVIGHSPSQPPPSTSCVKGLRAHPLSHKEWCGKRFLVNKLQLRKRRHRAGGRTRLLFPVVGGKCLLRHAPKQERYFIFFTNSAVETNETLFLSSEIAVSPSNTDAINNASGQISGLALFRAGVH